MADARDGTVYYKRSRFLTRLPTGRLYSRSHCWLLQVEPGLWRVGLTRFASRMLGDMVEFEIKVSCGQAVTVGQEIGWMEGFKAVTALYVVAEGVFERSNPELESDITLLDSKPYDAGWLYEIQGNPDPLTTDVEGYIALLDATIDKMLDSRHDGDQHG
jgi:glycine cleavage system H protein